MLRNPERDDDLPSSGAGAIELSRIHPGLLLRGPGVTRLRCCVLDLHSAPAQALCATRRQAVETEFYRWRGSFLPLVAHLRTRCERACVAAQFTSCDVGSPVSPRPPGAIPALSRPDQRERHGLPVQHPHPRSALTHVADVYPVPPHPSRTRRPGTRHHPYGREGAVSLPRATWKAAG